MPCQSEHLPGLILALGLALWWHGAVAEETLGYTERSSLSAIGLEGNNVSAHAALAAGGRFVGFASFAGNLVAGDTEICDALGPVSCFDVFVRDRLLRRTTRVSIAGDGSEAVCPANALNCSAAPALSASGRYVAFESLATNLVAADSNDALDVFVHDRDTDGDGIFDEPGARDTRLMSVTSDGVQHGAVSKHASISADGRHVAFQSAAQLVPADTNIHFDIYVRDRDVDRDGVFDEPGAVATVRVSVANSGEGGDRFSEFPSISGDGRFVVFGSFADNLVPDDSNGARDVFVHDRDADADGLFDEPEAVLTRRVSVSSSGDPGNSESSFADISGDGRYVAFSSWASNLVADDMRFCEVPFPSCSDVFVHDRDADEDGLFDEPGAILTLRVSISSAGAEADNDSKFPQMSGDGRFIVFQSEATNLVAGDSNGRQDIFLHDRDADEDGIFDEAGAVNTGRVSVGIAGLQGNSQSEGAAISGNGYAVAFSSSSDNLVRGDGNDSADVFVHEPRTAACMGIRATITGSAREDILIGTAAPDVISALGANDVIDGLGGNDVICGGAGDDLILGGAGFDRILGDSGDDRLDGGADTDLCVGGRHVAGDSAVNCEVVLGIP